MSKVQAGDSHLDGTLALRFHFLSEALRLDLLPSPLAQAVARLAAAAGSRDLDQRAREVGRVFLDVRDELGLEDVDWPAGEERSAGRTAQAALDRCQGEARPLAAAERLGRFCEELAAGGADRRGSGSYYTPGWAARAIADTLVQGVLKGRDRANPRQAVALRVLDPAVGAGAFAVAAVEAVAGAAGDEAGENDARRAAAGECIFGIEMNPLAADACRLGVWLAASRPGRPAPMPAEHLVVGDVLANRPRERGFDLVVGNPPWGVKLDRDPARRLAEASPEALRGHRNSYLFFLHLAAECARDDGGIGMLLPDALLWQVRYEGMRRALLERFRPLRVVLLGDGIFPAATAPACGLCLVGSCIAPEEFITSDLRRVPRSRLGEAVTETGWLAHRDGPAEATHHNFLVAPGWHRELLDRMRARHSTLGELGDRFQFHDSGINYPRAEVGRAVLYYGERESPSDIPVVRGRDFGPLTAIGHSAWLRHDWRDRVGPRDGLSVRERLYRRAPKLLLRQTGDRPVATVDRRGVWFGRSVIAVTAGSERELLWLAAVLNSDVFAALYRAVAPEGGRPFAQVKVNKLKAVPVPGGGEGEEAAAMLGEDDPARREDLKRRIEQAVAEAYGLTKRERARVAEEIGASS